ncbi:MAG: flagellum-specific ATP synthase FliI, partial [Burkholderiales bacterium]|nr:flagellum-specific ATP synthase FliI [Burkholderiales bacterium]
MSHTVNSLLSDIERIGELRRFGRIDGVQGLLVEAGGIGNSLSVGDRCRIAGRTREVLSEVVGFRQGKALLMPFSSLEGIGLGCQVEVDEANPVLHPHPGWLGRVINALGQPVDGLGPLPQGPVAYPIRNIPPPAHSRQRVSGKLDLGVRAMNAFLTTCRGQRMGIFAGSGVGKSSILSMMARHTEADI